MFSSPGYSIRRRSAVALLVVFLAVLVTGCSSTSTPTTPSTPSTPSNPSPPPAVTTYPFIDLTPGSTWTYRFATFDEFGNDVDYIVTWTVIGTDEFNNDSSAVKVEERLDDGTLVQCFYYKQMTDGIAQLGSEQWALDGGGSPVMFECTTYDGPLVFHADLKPAEIISLTSTMTTTEYWDESGAPLGSPKVTPEAYSVTYTVGPLETVSVGETQVSAYRMTDTDGMSVWIGPNGMGMVKMTFQPPFENYGYFLQDSTIK